MVKRKNIFLKQIEIRKETFKMEKFSKEWYETLNKWNQELIRRNEKEIHKEVIVQTIINQQKGGKQWQKQN